MKYAYVESLRGQHAIHKMCVWLNVSRSGYYKWRNREPSEQALRREQVRQAVILVFDQFKQRYGAPRIRVELNEVGISCCRNYVAKLMAETGLKARNGKNFKFYPSGNAINHVSDNLLGRDFSANAPDEKWVSDITYIAGAWLCLFGCDHGSFLASDYRLGSGYIDDSGADHRGL